MAARLFDSGLGGSGPRHQAAVRKQLDALDTAQDRPGLAAVALVLARDLDNPAAVPQHPALAHRLTGVLDLLAAGSRRPGRLSLIRSMTLDKP